MAAKNEFWLRLKIHVTKIKKQNKTKQKQKQTKKGFFQ